MGKGGSKLFSPDHSQIHVPEVKKKDGKKESSWKVKRNSYVICPTQNTQTAKIDPAEGGVSESTVQDGTRLAEVPDEEDNLLNETDEQGGILTSVDRRKSLLSTTYDNLTSITEEELISNDTISADSAAPDHVNYPVDTTENQMSSPYVNITLKITEGHIPNNTISAPESIEALSLRRNYRELKDMVLLETVCDHLIQDDVLQGIDYEMIKDGSCIRSLRVDILLQFILRRNSPEVFKAFSRILRKTGYEYLADKIENTDIEVLGKPYVRDWSSDFILNSWPQIENYLMAELQPEYILDFFMQENTFTLEEYEEVFWSMGKRKKMRKKLLCKIKNHLPEAFFVLLYALKEVKKGNEIIAEELEKLVEAGNDRQDASENSGAEESTSIVHLMAGSKANFTVKVPPSGTNPGCIVELTIEKEGNTVGPAENEIVKCINNSSNPCMFKVILPLTGCEITKSELGCVTIYLRPHSMHSFDNFFKFCKDKKLEKFVLNLLREKDILNSLPEGELCVNIHVQYHEKEVEAKVTEEPETDWEKSILDNRSFLCEELDVPNLINGSAKKITVFTAQETNELEERTLKDRHSAVDYFLQCLLEKGQAGINFLIDVLKEKNKKKILNRLQKSGPLYQNPQTVKENIIVYFESIIDEIDPIQFKDTFMDRKLLANTFFTDLMKNLRRRDRAALFLKEVINKGNNAIFALLDVMTDMNYDELLSKLVPLQETLLESKEQRQGEKLENISGNVSEMEEPIYMNVPFDNQDEVIGETEEAVKDETKKKVLGSTSEEEEPIYVNVPFDNQDEVIAETHGTSVTMRTKKGRNQPNGPKLHPKNCPSSLFELDETITFPRRTLEEARNDIHSLITSEDGPVTDYSCVDLNDTNNDPVSKTSSQSTPKGFIWSCCLKINVETKMKDETRERIFAISRQKEDPIYMNVPFDNQDEGIGGTDETYVTMRSKDGKNQANRPVTHPENSLPHLFEFDKSMTYPRTRESEEARKGIQSIINSATNRVMEDSCVDLSYDETVLFHETFPLKK